MILAGWAFVRLTDIWVVGTVGVKVSAQISITISISSVVTALPLRRPSWLKRAVDMHISIIPLICLHLISGSFGRVGGSTLAALAGRMIFTERRSCSDTAVTISQSSETQARLFLTRAEALAIGSAWILVLVIGVKGCPMLCRWLTPCLAPAPQAR